MKNLLDFQCGLRFFLRSSAWPTFQHTLSFVSKLMVCYASLNDWWCLAEIWIFMLCFIWVRQVCFVSDTAVIYTPPGTGEQIEECLRHVCGFILTAVWTCRAETSTLPLDDNTAYTVFICHFTNMFWHVVISGFYSAKSNCRSCQRSVQSNAKRQITFIVFTDSINASQQTYNELWYQAMTYYQSKV